MWNRRQLIAGAGMGGAFLLRGKGAAARQDSAASGAPASALDYRPVVNLNGRTAAWKWKDGAKEFHLVAEPLDWEFAPGMTVKCWGYNGTTPGPMIECVEGDRVRFYVTNKLPEHTTIHWHGILLPNGMDGVGGLQQPQINPGETYVYEFTLRQHGTFMYHPHADEMVQMAVGMMGMFVVHPRAPDERLPDRDFAFLLHEWAIEPGTYRPDPSVMLDFNLFTFNSKVFPAIDALVARKDDLVRIRLGNLSMDEHPIHLHGHAFQLTGTDGGTVPVSARHPETTVLVPPGATRAVDFVADAPGDWPIHCHKSHHTMNAMGHGVPNMLGVDTSESEARIRALLPEFMTMGEKGMAEHQVHSEHMEGPENTLPMMAGIGPYGRLEMGGMFTLLKVREGITSYEDPGWYEIPPGTQATKVELPEEYREG